MIERMNRSRFRIGQGRPAAAVLALLAVCLLIAFAPACKSKKQGGDLPVQGRSGRPAAAPDRAEAGSLPASPDPTLLLKEDLAKGVLTEDQAARYRIYRLFRPSEVPVKYRYPDMPSSGTWDLLQAGNRFDKLVPETVRELEPYFLPPSDPRSAFRFATSAPKPGFSLVPMAMAAEPGEDPPVVDLYTTDTGVEIAVVGEFSEAATVHKARALLEHHKIYEKFERLLGRKTLQTGDDPLWICISKDLRRFEDPQTPGTRILGFCSVLPRVPGGPIPPDKAACWIAVSAAGNETDPMLASTLSHEMFHAFQFAFSRREEKWLVEGSAVWSEDFAGRDWNVEQRRLDGWTFDPSVNIHNPLTQESRSAYGMFLFFEFLTRVRSGGGDAVMRATWERCEAVPGASLSSVVTGAGGDFKDIFKDYALSTLDVGDAKGRFPDQIGAYGGTAPLDLLSAHGFDGLWKIDADGAIVREGVNVVPGMGISYLRIDNSAEGPGAPAVRLDLSEFKAEKAIAVQAVVEYKNGLEVTEDWTGRDERVFCLSQESQNFVAISIAVSRAEEAAAKEFAMDLAEDPDAECSLGQLRITIGARTDEELKRTRKWFTENDAKTTNTVLDQEVTFLLELVPGSGLKTSDAESYVQRLPGEIRDKAKGRILNPPPEMSDHSGCLVIRYRVRSCGVSAFRWSRVLSGQETQNDQWGLEYDRKFEDRETRVLTGLDPETEKALRGDSFVVDVHFDPDSGEIRWVDVRGPLVAAAKAMISHRQAGRNRIKEDPAQYEDISRSSSEESEAHVRVLDVSKDNPDLPFNPDWRAKESGATRARGEGRAERPLDRERAGEQGERTVIKGSEVKTLRWDLVLSSNPRR